MSIVNNGDVPVYKIAFNTGSEGNINVQDGPAISLGSGQSTSIPNIPSDLVSITPILKGTKKGTEVEYTCDEKQIGVSSE